MADKDDTKQEDELEIVEVDEIPANVEEKPDGEDKPTGTAEEDDDEEDSRLGTNEDDDADDDKAKKRKRTSADRRAREKAARERKEAEIAELRQKIEQLTQLTTTLHGTQHSTMLEQTTGEIAKKKQEIEQAEAIMAAALKAQNFDDFVAAQNFRDAARDEIRDLEGKHQTLEKEKPQPYQQPGVDQRVVNYGRQWMQANPWYDPNGADEDSRITSAIDQGLVREGFNPADPSYWVELTKRVAARIGGEDDDEAPPRRKQPPTGTTREHVTANTKRQVYVTAERKQAMIEAGAWEDPVKRAKYLKAYQDYDRNAARS